MIKRGTTLKSIIYHCVGEITEADAEMQLAQRSAWRDLNNGFPLVEGLDHLEYLGLSEVKLTLRMKLVNAGWCSRILNRLRGRKRPVYVRLCSDGEPRPGCFSIEITLGRADGRVRVQSQPPVQGLEDMYVVDFPA